jgi:hypothetical protein
VNIWNTLSVTADERQSSIFVKGAFAILIHDAGLIGGSLAWAGGVFRATLVIRSQGSDFYVSLPSERIAGSQ